MLTKNRSRRFRYVLCFVIAILLFSLAFHFRGHKKAWKFSENPVSQCLHLCPYKSNLGCRRMHFDTYHWVKHFPEFVCPQNFRNMADWIFGWPDQFNENVETAPNSHQISRCLPNGSIIYVRIWAIDEFFKHVYPNLINDFVLITGEGDISSPTFLNHLDEPSSKIIHWFGQNGQHDVNKVKKFTHIPIGKFLKERYNAQQLIFGENA